MKWFTREHVHFDRVASPWLIERFVDPTAEFIFVPTEKIEEVVEKEKAIPFDVPNVELGHKDNKCTFDAIKEKYKLKDPALLELAKIIRAADTPDKALAPESVGLEAIAVGSMMIVKDDFEAIEKQKFLYNSLYAHCKLRLIKERYKYALDSIDRKQRFSISQKEDKRISISSLQMPCFTAHEKGSFGRYAS